MSFSSMRIHVKGEKKKSRSATREGLLHLTLLRFFSGTCSGRGAADRVLSESNGTVTSRQVYCGLKDEHLWDLPVHFPLLCGRKTKARPRPLV